MGICDCCESCGELHVFSSCPAFLKLVTLVLGVITLGLTADSYYMPNVGNSNPMETFYLAVVTISFIASIILLFIFTIIQDDSKMTKKMEVLFHLVAGLFLIISAALWFVSVYKHYVLLDDRGRRDRRGIYVPPEPDTNFIKRFPRAQDYTNFVKRFPKDSFDYGNNEDDYIAKSQSHHMERMAAGILGAVNGVVYLTISILIWFRVRKT